MAPPTPPHPPGNIGDRKRKRIADDGASPSDDPPAALLPPQSMSTQVTDAAVSAIADKVGDLVGTLWDYSFGLVANIIFLSRKADEVAEEMEKLRSLRDDLMRRAEDEARRTPANVSNQLERWMGKVSSFAEDVAKFQRSLEDRSSFITRFRLRYDAVELLKQARKLAEEGNYVPLTCPRGPEPVEQVPFDTSSSTLAGGREALERVQRLIMDDDIGIIGLYGMGGVGKTTLLKLINNEFLRGETCRDKFDVAIWVTVSRGVQISNIRETIARRLGLPSHTSKDELFRHLSEKRFILLLDDVWEKLDLTEIGIPLPQTMNHNCKILFTTRNEQVCGEMDFDQKVKIISLDRESSWELFRSKLGRGAAVLDNNPSIRQLAEEVVRRCGGLPLALITVGRAMSSAKTESEWEDARRRLDQCAADLPQTMNHSSKILFTTRNKQVCGEMDADEKVKVNLLNDKSSWELFVRRAMSNANTEFQCNDARRKWDRCAVELSPGMEDNVLKSLKFSFEMLKDEAHRNCLLYCALFPEDFEISKEEIIDMWICEGFLDEEDNIEDTRCRGNVLISELQKACLLEEGSNDRTVMLHDTVREMALWIAGHDFVVLPGSDSYYKLVPKPSIWENARRISLMYNRSINKPPPPSSSRPNLTTLLLQSSPGHSREIFAKSFISFTSMPALKVLDLNAVGLSEFPIEITSLTSLNYLCLSYNKFTSFPVELGNLTNLRILILRYCSLTSIPAEAISRLSHLQVLDMIGSNYKFGDFNTYHHLQQLELSDLANLKRLSELYLSVLCSWASLDVIVASPVLRQSTRNLDIRVFSISQPPPPPPPPTGDTISWQICRLSDLRRLHLEANPSVPVMGELLLYPISRLHQNLKSLCIEHFREAKFSFNNISYHSSEPLFPRLRELWILYCDGCAELTWVGRLPCLEKLKVTGCKGLREVMMPLDGGGSLDHHPIMPSSFPKLKRMDLRDLPSLRSISTSTLLFPCLEELCVYECPRLQRLPFAPQSAQNLEIIHGQKAWWDELEWDDDAHQQSFSSKFQEWDGSGADEEFGEY